MTRTQTFIVMVTLLALAQPATAQNRLLLPTLPDLDLYPLAAPGALDENGLRLQFGTQAESWFDLGATQPTQGRYATSGSAGIEWRPNRLTAVTARSDITGSGDFHGGDPSDSLRGWHRLSLRTGVGDPSGPLGIDLRARYQSLHAGRDQWLLPPSDIAWGENFSDETVEVGLWPRTGDDDDLLGVMPLKYALRTVSYPRGGGPVGGFRTHSFSSGIGLTSYDDDVTGGWWELLGATYSRTNYTAPAGESAGRTTPGRPPLPGHERIDWRILNLNDGIIGDDELLLGLHFHLGASWLWDAERERSYSAFTGAMALRARFDEGEVGFGVAKEALATPDGQQFTEAYRAEAVLAFLLPNTGTGLDIRAAYHQFGSDEKGPEPRRSAALRSRWFMTPTKWSKLGSYHLAHYGARVESGIYDPFHYASDWGHELGVFLELNHGL